MKKWTVYILRCKDKTLYTGITTNISDRIKAHNSGKGAKYTKGRGPVKLVWKKIVKNESAARKMEYKIKSLSREKKVILVASNNSQT